MALYPLGLFSEIGALIDFHGLSHEILSVFANDLPIGAIDMGGCCLIVGVWLGGLYILSPVEGLCVSKLEFLKI